MDFPSKQVYTFETPDLIVAGEPVNPFHYKLDQSYSIETWEALNEWLRTNSLQIDNVPVNIFERDSKGRLIAMPQVPVGTEVAVAAISEQLSAWNRFLPQRGVVTTSQGGFLIGPGMIRAPDVAYTPFDISSTLTQDQQFTSKGAPFCPTFVVEVDDLTIPSRLDNLTTKIKDAYFPSGVQLAWLVDPVNKIFYNFKATKDGAVRRSSLPWYNGDHQPTIIKGDPVLPGFNLWLSQVDKVYTAFDPNAPPAGPQIQFTCSQCNGSFAGYALIEHLKMH